MQVQTFRCHSERSEESAFLWWREEADSSVEAARNDIEKLESTPHIAQYSSG
jgi:hypothetical protein